MQTDVRAASNAATGTAGRVEGLFITAMAGAPMTACRADDRVPVGAGDGR